MVRIRIYKLSNMVTHIPIGTTHLIPNEACTRGAAAVPAIFVHGM